MNWTQKEKNFLKELQSEEKLCAEKYHKAAGAACDAGLRQMLERIEQAEQGHHDTVTRMLAGEMPAPKAQAQPPKARPEKELKARTTRAEKQSDAFLLADLLASEKYVAGVYNTAVFEFSDPAARQLLAGIQQAEQNHGKELADYMQANGMYN